jgi:DNA polymerase III subunit alpha
MINLQNYSHYTLLNSTIKPKQLVEWAVQMNEAAVCITDLNSMAGAIQLYNAATKAGIKPIIGITLLLNNDATIVLLAQNKIGYENLLEILYQAGDPKHCINGSVLNIDRLAECDVTGIIALTGHDGSSLFKKITNFSGTVDENKLDIAKVHCQYLQSIFGDRLYLQIEPHFINELSSTYKQIAKSLDIKVAYTNQVRYIKSDASAYLFDVIRATNKKCLISSLHQYEQIAYPYSGHHVWNGANDEIVNRIEEYSITCPPQLPIFATPDGSCSYDYLRQIAWNNLRAKFSDNIPVTYIERMKKELESFKKEGLEDYFLILADIVNYTHQNGYLTGPGRGSAAGCLTSYLLKITQVDPIKYGLVFERFWNPGRAGSMPDIDVDFPKCFRDSVIKYIENKYTTENVGQIVTYQTMVGRAALKNIMRAEGKVSPTEMNEITKYIIDKAQISDELEEMKQNGLEPSVIRWALMYKGSSLSQWAELTDDNKIVGPLASNFEHAIALEGIKSAMSKHPSGIVIGRKPLRSTVPTIYDPKLKKRIVNLEYEDAEQCSLTKLDCLGIVALDKMMEIE